MNAKRKSVNKAVVYATVPFVIELVVRILFLRHSHPWWDIPNTMTLFLIASVFCLFFQSSLTQIKLMPSDDEKIAEFSETVKRFGHYAFINAAFFGVLITVKTIDQMNGNNMYYYMTQPFSFFLAILFFSLVSLDVMVQARNYIK
ncbi:hypothetical protein ABC955_09800 [Citromicrobium bathyomarinum]